MAVSTLVTLQLGSVGCKRVRRTEAADAYQLELGAHGRRFQRFSARYSEIEQQLNGIRGVFPKKAVTVIRTEMIPLITQMVDGVDRLITRGYAYVKLLDDSVKDKPGLNQSLSTFRTLRRVFVTVRQSYLDEVKLLEGATPDRAALDKVYDRRVAAFKQTLPGTR